jgi:integrase
LQTSVQREAAKMVQSIDSKIERIFTDCKLGFLGISESRAKIEAVLRGGSDSGELTLQEISKNYEDQYGKKWNNKGRQEFWKAINVIIQHVGNRPPRLIDDNLMAQVRDKILHSKEDMKLTTVNKYLSRISAVFKFAMALKIITHNPCTLIKFPVTKNDKLQAQYRPYSDNDVKSLLEMMLVKSDFKDWQPYMYWLPLLGAFTGARLGDLGDLKKDNIEQRKGIWIINISNKKTGGLPRAVPIHSRLIWLGFLKWIDTLGDGQKLFNLTQRKDNGEYDYKWYYFAQRLFIEDEQKSFHSWRKTISSRLNDAGITATWRADLLGHERKTDGETDKSYTINTDIKSLKNAIEKLEYPSVNWEAVKS